MEKQSTPNLDFMLNNRGSYLVQYKEKFKELFSDIDPNKDYSNHPLYDSYEEELQGIYHTEIVEPGWYPQFLVHHGVIEDLFNNEKTSGEEYNKINEELTSVAEIALADLNIPNSLLY